MLEYFLLTFALLHCSYDGLDWIEIQVWSQHVPFSENDQKPVKVMRLREDLEMFYPSFPPATRALRKGPAVFPEDVYPEWIPEKKCRKAREIYLHECVEDLHKEEENERKKRKGRE